MPRCRFGMDSTDWLEWNEQGDEAAPPLSFYMLHESYDWWRWGKISDEEFDRRVKADWPAREEEFETGKMG